MLKIFEHHEAFELESGTIIKGFHLAYTTLGRLNEEKDNAVWVFHALTADSNPADWWPGLVGEGQLFDPAHYFIICVNMPGSCYGSTHPLDTDPVTKEVYYHDFPLFTIRDMVKAYMHLRKFMGIEKIYVGLGGSMGGQQLLEWAVTEPQLFDHIIPIATNAVHSPWGIAFNASQRMCIEVDETWKEKHAQAGINGMKVARSVALISYRNYETYHLNQSEAADGKIEAFKSESYQRYQGDKLARRFDAFSYYFLSKSMDSHNLGRGRNSMVDALQSIQAKTLVIGIETDILFPVAEQVFLAKHIPLAVITVIQSTFGHDGFLLEFGQITKAVKGFLANDPIAKLQNELIK